MDVKTEKTMYLCVWESCFRILRRWRIFVLETGVRWVAAWRDS